MGRGRQYEGVNCETPRCKREAVSNRRCRNCAQSIRRGREPIAKEDDLAERQEQVAIQKEVREHERLVMALHRFNREFFRVRRSD